MSDRTLRHKVAIVGVGETQYFKYGQSPDPEFKLALKAIFAACASAGISPHAIDGFASYSDDRNDTVRLAAALGIPELRHSSMQWGGGGGGAAAAVAHAAAAIAGGLAECVVVFRALAQGQFVRYGQGGMAFGYGSATPVITGEMAFPGPHGAISPAQRFAMKVRRFMEEYGIEQAALRAIAVASYHHAQANPRALMRGRPLDEAQYDASRWIVEPFRLFDCCMETDSTPAIVQVSAESDRNFQHPTAYLLRVEVRPDHRHATSHP